MHSLTFLIGVKMKLKTINSSKITWVVHPAESFHDFTESYCADGDGLVSIQKTKTGTYDTVCDYEYFESFNKLSDALESGERLLARYYPEVYEQKQF